ncbi:MAG: inositol monophosphatase family protein [Aeromicrobium sp.]|uniref:inositol monophosphatase family protein n=1 Tax=Aeromicrobium sp. TaxID=1871063 RepID=UPI0039E2B59A
MEGLELFDLAVAVGREAAALVRDRRPPVGRVAAAAVKSSQTDPVTEIDRASEDLIRSLIARERPEDAFWGEERGPSSAGTSGVEWIVDPIDGTVNFMYGIPAYAVSVAARDAEGVAVGFVTNVADGREWGAERGRGAWRLDGVRRRIQAPVPPPSLDRLLVATGFGYDPQVRAAQGEAVALLLPQVRDIRRIGAAALDLCAVAEGTVDAYVERGLQPWDDAAAGLIATEADCALDVSQDADGRRLVAAAHRDIAAEYFSLVRACGF